MLTLHRGRGTISVSAALHAVCTGMKCIFSFEGSCEMKQGTPVMKQEGGWKTAAILDAMRMSTSCMLSACRSPRVSIERKMARRAILTAGAPALQNAGRWPVLSDEQLA